MNRARHEARHQARREGLASAAQVEALADQLVAVADALHARVMHAVGNGDGQFSEAEQAAARALLEDEQMLRASASGLYADAARYVVQALGQSQDHLLHLTAQAAEKIRTIGHIAEAGALVGAILGLAAALASGRVPAIIAAINKVSRQAEKIGAGEPNKAA